MPLQACQFLGEVSPHKSYSPSFLLARASGEQLANHNDWAVPRQSHRWKWTVVLSGWQLKQGLLLFFAGSWQPNDYYYYYCCCFFNGQSNGHDCTFEKSVIQIAKTNTWLSQPSWAPFKLTSTLSSKGVQIPLWIIPASPNCCIISLIRPASG